MNNQIGQLNPYAPRYVPFNRGNRGPLQFIPNSPPTIPSPLVYMTGLRAELFRELINRHIVNDQGIVLKKIQLPQLSKEEIRFIKNELFSEFKIVLSDTDCFSLSMGVLMTLFSRDPEITQNFHVNSTEINGGFVFFLLFKKKFNGKSYIERVFKALSIADLYPKYASLFKTTDKKPSDLDCRMSIFKKGTYYIIDRKDLIFFKNKAIDQIALLNFKYSKEREEWREKIREKSSPIQGTVHDYPNVFQLIKLKESPIDWVIYRLLRRKCVFNHDALYLPIETLLTHPNNSSKITLIPQTYESKGIQIFIDCLLGIVRSSNTTTIDHKGWMRFLSWRTKGAYSLPLNKQGFFQEEKLFKAFEDYHQDTGCYRLNEEINAWLSKHDPENSPLFRPALVLNAATFVKEKIPPKEIAILLEMQLQELFLSENTLASLIATCLVKEQMPLQTLIDFIQVAALLHGNIQRTGKQPLFTIGTEEGRHPTLNLQLGDYVWQMPLFLEAALNRLALCDSLKSQELISLYFLLSPKGGSLSEELKQILGVENHTLFENYLALIGKSPLLSFMALDFISKLPEQNPLLAGCLLKNALRHSFTILSTLGNSAPEQENRIITQLEQIVGINTLSFGTLIDPRSLWLNTLFNMDPEVGCEVWQEMVNEAKHTDFSFGLISSLTINRPKYATRLLVYLIHHIFAERPDKSLHLLSTCYYQLMDRQLDEDSKELFLILTRYLIKLITNPRLKLNLEGKDPHLEKVIIHLLPSLTLHAPEYAHHLFLLLSQSKENVHSSLFLESLLNHLNQLSKQKKPVKQELNFIRFLNEKLLSFLQEPKYKKIKEQLCTTHLATQLLLARATSMRVKALIIITLSKISPKLLPNLKTTADLWISLFDFTRKIKDPALFNQLYTVLLDHCPLGPIASFYVDYQNIYSCLIFFLKIRQSDKILHLLNYTVLLKEIYSNPHPTAIVFQGLCTLILAASESKEKLTNQQKDNLFWAYNRLISLDLHQIINQPSNQFLDNLESKFHESLAMHEAIQHFPTLKARTDITFVSLSLSDQNEQTRSCALDTLDMILETIHTNIQNNNPDPCWPFIYSPDLLNKLCTSKTAVLLEKALGLMRLTYLSIPDLNCRIIKTLGEKCTTKGSLIGLQLWRQLPDSMATWRQIEPFLIHLLNPLLPDHDSLICQLFHSNRFASLQWDEMQRYLEFTVLYLSQTEIEECNASFQISFSLYFLMKFFSIEKEIPPSQLNTIKKALITVSRLNIKSFESSCTLFWKHPSVNVILRIELINELLNRISTTNSSEKNQELVRQILQGIHSLTGMVKENIIIGLRKEVSEKIHSIKKPEPK